MSEIAAETVGSGPIGNDQPDPVSSFSFGADLHKQAMDFAPETPSTPEPAQAVQEHAVVAQPEPTDDAKNVDNASAAQLAQLKDTDLVEVTVDGQAVQMPWGQAKGGVMRQAHYTREMQALRQREQQFESQSQEIQTLRQQHEAMVTVLRNRDLVKELVQKQYPDLLAAQQAVQAEAAKADPDDIVTVGQLEQIRQQTEQRIQAVTEALVNGLQEHEQQIARNIETRNATLKLATEVNTTIKSLFSEHQHIAKLIPDAEQVLRYNVMKLNPKTPEETLEAFKTVFGGWVEQYNHSVAETTKTKAVAKQKMLATNIQPPGGAGVQPQPTTFKKVDKITGKETLDWDKLHQAALAAL